MISVFVRLKRSAGYFLTRRRTAVALLGAALALPGCAFLSGKPPLPKRASLEEAAKPVAETNFTALVENADVIYFPSDRAASGARSEPSALLLEALRQNGTPFTIGWDLIETSQQPWLDELQSKTGSAREELIDRLFFGGSGRAREHCRAVLRDSRDATLHHLALRCPDVLMAKLDRGEKLTAEEERQLPRGYAPPRGGFEGYAERLASSENINESGMARSYRAHLMSQQFAAERIVRHFRADGGPAKLLVFLRASDLEAGVGVPRYVAQKIQLRQLVLDSTGSAPLRAKLLTRRDAVDRSF